MLCWYFRFFSYCHNQVNFKTKLLCSDMFIVLLTLLCIAKILTKSLLSTAMLISKFSRLNLTYNFKSRDVSILTQSVNFSLLSLNIIDILIIYKIFFFLYFLLLMLLLLLFTKFFFFNFYLAKEHV